MDLILIIVLAVLFKFIFLDNVLRSSLFIINVVLRQILKLVSINDLWVVLCLVKERLLAEKQVLVK